MYFVENEEKYWEFIRKLRTNEEVIQGFVQQGDINPEQQEIYMKKYGHMYYICILDDKPVGFIGVIDRDIRVATHPDFQKRGVGKFMINELMKLHPDSLAKVKVDNQASLRLFESCGFTKKFYLLEK
mgnify:CR=1 FL=1